ncbi:hypothetical protein [Salinisphaera sp.]|uniref:hypothetical protein n=1 Tax=Salinisphaera sp. TaxID=1914330 RepID=UPI002D7973A8|nr:hypothetical protein [Salinisphaera sp.]HET7314364.1 hypothetical protein [Salinisphaera sp.]
MHKGSLVMAIIWMAVISLVLFWLPLVGPLLAGFVGGRTAGGAGRGLLAAILPALVLCLILAAAGASLTGLPVIGAIASISLFLVIVIQGFPLLIGAVIGGLTV